MRHSKRTFLTTEDVDTALALRNLEVTCFAFGIRLCVMFLMLVDLIRWFFEVACDMEYPWYFVLHVVEELL